MPTLDEWKQQVLQAAQNGDREGARAAAKAYVRRQAIEKQTAEEAKGYGGPVEMETVPFARGGTVTRPKYPAQSMLEGAGSGLVNVGRRATHLAGAVANALRGTPLEADMPEWSTNRAIDEQTQIDKPLLGTGEGTLGRIGGEMAATAPISGLGSTVTKGATAVLPKASGVLRALAGLTGSAAEGALGSELTTGDAGAGAAWGAGLGAAGQTLGKIGKGLKRTEGAERLLDAGVDLTPGQMNPSGILNQSEQALDSIPVAKQIIQPVRKGAEDAIVPTLVGNAAKVPAGEIDDTMSRALDQFDKRYEQFKSLPAKRTDTTLIKSLSDAVKTPGVLAKDDTRQMVRNLVGSELTALKGKSANGLSVGDWQEVRSRLRAMGRKTEDDAAKDLLDKVDEALTTHINNSMPSDAQAAFKAVDADYAKYKPWEKAYYRAGDRKGGPTLKQATDALKRTMSESQWARGTGGQPREMLQDAREAFENVSRPTGARMLTVAAGAAALPAAAVTAGFGPLRRWSQGRTGWQKGLKSAAKNPAVAEIVNLLRDTRGSQAAALDRYDEEQQ